TRRPPGPTLFPYTTLFRSVGVGSRRRMILIAGTFVLVSGLMYFAFMAAWLNAFLLVGFSRPLQLALGALAAVIGVLHMKDFFARSEERRVGKECRSRWSTS